MKPIIRRERYMSRIAPFIWKDIVKILVGQRRVGKSSILRDLMNYLVQEKGVESKNICYINREDMSWDHIRTYTDLYDAVKNYTHICIDEIQEIPEWERAIRSLVSAGGYDIYITGSNAGMLSGELATVLAGRYVSFEIFPLTYSEFLIFSWDTLSEESFFDYMQRWGLPYVHHLEKDPQVTLSYLRDVVDTILLRDIIIRNNIRNTAFFHRLMIYLAREIAHIFSAKKISDYLKNEKISLSNHAIMDYLQFAEDANLLVKVDRYDIRWKRVFETKHKFFFTDIGIRNALVGGYRQIDVSGVLENIVCTHLLAYGWQVSVWELDIREVDFIATRGNDTMYIQIAYIIESEETRAREFAPLLAISDNYPKYVISLDRHASGHIEGIEWWYIPDFLLSLSEK